MISEQRGNAEDMTFLTTLSSVHPNISPQADIRAVYFVDMCLGRKWYSVVFSYSINGIHDGGSPGSSSLLLPELSLKIPGAEDL